MQIIISNNIHLSDVPNDLNRMIKEKLTMTNPEWLKLNRLGKWTSNTPQQLQFYAESPEGFDCKNLSNLFLATPIKFSGRLLQYLRRVLRPAPGKDRARIFDYIDARVPVLKYSARAREAVYHE